MLRTIKQRGYDLYQTDIETQKAEEKQKTEYERSAN